MAGAPGKEETEPVRPKFSPTLTKEEIEEDFIKMTGAKPPGRPKIRGRNVQRQLNALVSGGWLTEVMPKNYNTPPGKKGIEVIKEAEKELVESCCCVHY